MFSKNQKSFTMIISRFDFKIHMNISEMFKFCIVSVMTIFKILHLQFIVIGQTLKKISSSFLFVKRLSFLSIINATKITNVIILTALKFSELSILNEMT